MKPYDDDLVEFIENNRLELTTLEMVKEIKEKFDKDITPKTLRKYYDRHNLDYKKIYKRTDKNVNAKPIGSESNPDKNGLVRVKINKKQWVFKQRYIYEKHYGKIPKGYVVIFLDGDKTNFKKKNLMAVPRKQATAFYGLTNKEKITNKKLTETGILVAQIVNRIQEIKRSDEVLTK